ncbi:Flavin monooxygenase-like [Dillenia turbinata]|uniref:Flavin-containing monooxygenase n=1 Tax=Dillenia turbinata TaxID=194707 RepID=A0AAN8VTC3_9MAGN
MSQETGEQVVIVVGAGPAGLATAACLASLSIPYMLIEREDLYAPIWTKKSYDRLHLHLAKHFCELPHMPMPAEYPTYVPRVEFVQYLDNYVRKFHIKPLYNRSVIGAEYEEVSQKWHIKVHNSMSDESEEYQTRFLIVATGETSDTFVPDVEGLHTFSGRVIHSTQYKSGKEFSGQNVLVIGSGNSGMEIAFDLSNFGAKTSIVVRSPIHILSKGMAHLGLTLLKYLPHDFVDSLLLFLSKIYYGDLRKYGIERPKESPFYLKDKYGKYPVFDVGTYKKIKSGEIQVLPAVTSIKGDEVFFKDGKSHAFDVIIFATGFKRSTTQWLKGDDYLLGDDGISKQEFPNHWKGKNGLYCVGLARKGLYGIHMDAKLVADHIKTSAML